MDQMLRLADAVRLKRRKADGGKLKQVEVVASTRDVYQVRQICYTWLPCLPVSRP